MKVQEIKLEDLIPYENNPRKNDAAVDPVANSIKEFGFRVPIIIDKENVIVAGHTRYKAAQKLGLKKVPCVVADDLTGEQINAFRLADNKTAELAGWDFDMLAAELEEINDIDMNEFGFDITEMREDDGEAPEARFNYKEQYGVIVICAGEAEQEEVYNRLTDEGFTCRVVTT